MFRSKDFDRVILGIGLIICVCFYSLIVDRSPKSGVRRDWQADNTAPCIMDHKRQTLRRIYASQIGVREKTGKNDGPEVEEYLRYVGLGRGNAWCAAFVSWTFHQAVLDKPKTAWSPALFPDNRLTSNPQTGDVFGIYFQELKRIAHCGFVDEWSSMWCITVEANTNGIGSVMSENDAANPIRAGPGEGVYRKKRLVRTIYKVADWISSSTN